MPTRVTQSVAHLYNHPLSQITYIILALRSAALRSTGMILHYLSNTCGYRCATLCSTSFHSSFCILHFRSSLNVFSSFQSSFRHSCEGWSKFSTWFLTLLSWNSTALLVTKNINFNLQGKKFAIKVRDQ